MEISNLTIFFLFTFHCFFNLSLSYRFSPSQGTVSVLQTYIVHVKQPESRVLASAVDRENWHKSFLPITVQSSGEQRMVYSYGNAISGFAARLSVEEVKAMEKMDGFVSARPDRLVPLLTTHTPSFLGLQKEKGVWKDSDFGKGVIVGFFDGGIMPNHPSFSDEGIPPPPKKWKGRCEFNASICNNKLIGARSFNLGAKAMKGVASDSPIDEDGHGTHTASTAVGNFVENVNLLGNANGTAVGMAPYAHVAVYKVCFGDVCANSDTLAAIESAVEDGVDVLSLSLGDPSMPFYEDNIAIGAFGAIEKGIFVSCSAGNSGPFNSTLSNDAPWILTVGASNTDRSIRTTAKLGNGDEIDGESIFVEDNYRPTFLPLIFPGATGNLGMINCEEGSLNGTDVRGKVVLCIRGGATGRVAKGSVVMNAGGAAMILVNREQDGFSTLADVHVLATTAVSFPDGSKIMSYINSTNNPVAVIFHKGTVIGGTSPSPMVASFSSRGPSTASPGILKPDIIGPGVSILAAWPFQVGPPSPMPTFNIMSGTSMSAPHLSGIAALLKSSHPDWSPAAIKSALMTTSDILNHQGKPIVDETLNPADLFATGVGHVNPSKSIKPGLVYDIQPEDYIHYLCGLGYNDNQVGIITRRLINCSSYGSISEGNLNYPSFSVSLGPSQIFTRTLTNVGEAYSRYTVQIAAPEGVYVSVSPTKLYFSKVNQRLSFKVSFSGNSSARCEVGSSPFSQGSLTWVSSKYSVRSPISITFK